MSNKKTAVQIAIDMLQNETDLTREEQILYLERYCIEIEAEQLAEAWVNAYTGSNSIGFDYFEHYYNTTYPNSPVFVKYVETNLKNKIGYSIFFKNKI